MARTAMFSNPKPIIGMIHIGALPGTPAGTQSVAEIIVQAVREAAVYRECGVDGIAIENMHDVPYLRGSVGPEIVAAMTLAGRAVKSESEIAQDPRQPLRPLLLAGAGRGHCCRPPRETSL